MVKHSRYYYDKGIREGWSWQHHVWQQLAYFSDRYMMWWLSYLWLACLLWPFYGWFSTMEWFYFWELNMETVYWYDSALIAWIGLGIYLLQQIYYICYYYHERVHRHDPYSASKKKSIRKRK